MLEIPTNMRELVPVSLMCPTGLSTFCFETIAQLGGDKGKHRAKNHCSCTTGELVPVPFLGSFLAHRCGTGIALISFGSQNGTFFHKTVVLELTL